MSSPSSRPGREALDGVNTKSLPSPAEQIKVDPIRERKLEERLVRGPGSSSQIGFNSNNLNANEDTRVSVSSVSNAGWEDSKGNKESSRLRASNENGGTATVSANTRSNSAIVVESSEEALLRKGPVASAAQFMNRAGTLENFFAPKNTGLKRTRSEEVNTSEGSNNEETDSATDKISPDVDKKSEFSNSEDNNNNHNNNNNNDGEETVRLGEDDMEEEDDFGGGGGPNPTDSPSKGGKSKKGRFTPEEDECILSLQIKYGNDWKLVSQQGGPVLLGRTINALARRYATLARKNSATPKGTNEDGTCEAEDDEVVIIDGPSSSTSAAASTSQPPISNFFRPNGSIASNNSSTKRARPSSPNPSALVAQHVAEIQKLTLELEKTKREKHEAETTLEQRTKESTVKMEEMRARLGRASEIMQNILRNSDKSEAARIRKACSEASFSLGRFATARAGPVNHQLRDNLREVWEDGQIKKELQVRSDHILQQKADLERQQKQIRSNKRKSSGNVPETLQSQLEAELEERALEEMRTLRLAKLKQEEAQLAEDRAKWMIEKQLHIRELRRIKDEDASKYSERPVLENRYLLRSLLGKGGFSEVWKAFDLIEMRDVAIKIHELDPSWSEERRRNYSKHAKREYRIHLAVKHPRIVQLYDVIEINQSSCFATVLEFCPGTDLDFHLKKHKCLPEKEAKAILMQILSALLCLSTGAGVKDTTSIIHYDIKPANILFDADGGIKLTDFGLSKIISDEHDSAGIELTSQGAGTYWYLPPECFNFDRTNPPRISNKVDVWSTGVVFFQMLFGQRPFGEGLSQDNMLKSETVLRATKVEFPSKPVVSDAAKDFIRRCLTYSQDLRPTVEKLCEDPYLRPVKKKASTVTTSGMVAGLPNGD